MAQTTPAPKTVMQKVLDVVERVGNKVPHPAIIFLGLLGLVILLSAIVSGASVSFETIDPVSNEVIKQEVTARSLLTADGLRFMYTTLVPSFMGFAAVALIIVAMVGVGVSEESGLINALIRKLVAVSPKAALAYILVFVGILSSIAADAGYLVLIPLAGTAFLSVGRHPLAGLAAGFAAVAGAFTVNMLVKPLDAILTEFTNDAIHLVKPDVSIGLTANLWFSIVSVVFLTVIITVITERIIEPRLGTYTGKDNDASAGKAGQKASPKEGEKPAPTPAQEARGLLFAGLALLVTFGVFLLLTVPAAAPLRNPTDGALIGDSPFMNHLIVLIMVVFLAAGVAFGIGAGTLTSATAVIKAIEKSVSGLGSLIFLLLIISQFIAYFNYSNMATVLAVNLADGLQRAEIGPLWLLLGFIIVVMLLDLLITGAIAKWAIFAPVFVPPLVMLGVAPEAVLAAYRIGDSPLNAITPLNAYFALVVVFAQRYDKSAGVGTVVALMLPYVAITSVLWIALFIVWFLLGLPWGLN